MSFADDILFEPINSKSKSFSYQPFLDAVRYALDGLQDFVFDVNPSIPIAVYDQIAEMVETDQTQIAYVKQMVSYDPQHNVRPATALSIRDVFRRLHQGESKFYYTARANGGGIHEYEFANWFGIEHRMPVLELLHQQPPKHIFEWWVVSMLSDFCGYNQYYAFATEQDARQYYAIPIP